MKHLRLSGLFATAMTLALLAGGIAGPTSAADFYKGKTINIVVGTTPGGTNDFIARTLGDHMMQYIPGKPRYIIRGMPGAGSVRSVNFLVNVGPQDGTYIGTLIRGIILGPLFRVVGSNFDPSKFNWLGSVNQATQIAVVWHTTGVTSIDDIKKRQIIAGGTGPSTGMSQFPAILNAVLGTKFKVIYGYPGGNQVNLALERGEVEARLGWTYRSAISEKPHWFKKGGKARIILQMGIQKNPELKGIPWVNDLIKNKDDLRAVELLSSPMLLGRPYFAPPGVPADRVKILRVAFEKTMKDKGFIKDANKRLIPVGPVSAKQIEDLIKKVYATPQPIVDRVIAALDPRKMVKRKVALAKVTAKVTKKKRGGRRITLANGKTYRISGRFTKKLTVAGVTGRVRGKIKVGMTCTFEADGTSVIRGECK